MSKWRIAHKSLKEGDSQILDTVRPNLSLNWNLQQTAYRTAYNVYYVKYGMCGDLPAAWYWNAEYCTPPIPRICICSKNTEEIEFHEAPEVNHEYRHSPFVQAEILSGSSQDPYPTERTSEWLASKRAGSIGVGCRLIQSGTTAWGIPPVLENGSLSPGFHEAAFSGVTVF